MLEVRLHRSLVSGIPFLLMAVVIAARQHACLTDLRTTFDTTVEDVILVGHPFSILYCEGG